VCERERERGRDGEKERGSLVPYACVLPPLVDSPNQVGRLTGAVRNICVKSRRSWELEDGSPSAVSVEGGDSAGSGGVSSVGGLGTVSVDSPGDMLSVGKKQRVQVSEEAIALAAKARQAVSQVKVAVTEAVKFAGKTVE
jgi:hypothetical protein